MLVFVFISLPAYLVAACLVVCLCSSLSAYLCVCEFYLLVFFLWLPSCSLACFCICFTLFPLVLFACLLHTYLLVCLCLCLSAYLTYLASDQSLICTSVCLFARCFFSFSAVVDALPACLLICFSVYLFFSLLSPCMAASYPVSRRRLSLCSSVCLFAVRVPSVVVCGWPLLLVRFSCLLLASFGA